jgi:hypothetical protein
MVLLESDAEASLAALDEGAALAEAHGLTEEEAWVLYARVEAGLVSGRWDDAIDAGLQALDLADRFAYHRVQVRTWSALSPIAAATGRVDLLERTRRWFDAHDAIFPRSPFGNVMRAGINHRLADAGLIGIVRVDAADVLPAWEESQGLPSWHASVESMVDGWLATGDLDAVRSALDRIVAWRDHPTTEVLGRGVEDLLRARLLQAEGDTAGAVAAGRRAAGEFRTCHAPWWTAKAIRAVEAAGGTQDGEVEEAGRIEEDLGLSGMAR